MPKRKRNNIDILEDVLQIEADLVENRRYFHANPELSFQEVNTARYISEQLKSYGGDMKITIQVGKTGVVAVLKGLAGDGPCIGLRADMDALPIQETTGLSFSSKNPNVMHACGHDGHMSILLGVAKVLSSNKWREKLCGSVKFLFQPAEEGYAGAKAMIDDGCLENPHVDEIYGLHVWNYNPSCQVFVKDGPLMASSDNFDITIHGKGGHGAVPHVSQDAMMGACHLCTMLQTIVSRNVSPLDNAVLTVGQINGGFNHNVIADKVVMNGTVRTFSEETQDYIIKRMNEMCDGVSKAMQVEAKLDYMKKYPCTNNRSKVHVDKIRQAATSIVGSDAVLEAQATMAAEDMSFFLNERPGCFFFLGSSPDENNDTPHHKSNFTIDEACLPVGTSIFVKLIDNLLTKS